MSEWEEIECFRSRRQVSGLLFIGDPHIEGRTPGFRKDDYPETILSKFHWCLDYARTHELQPVLLGDLFDKPRDNPNWLMARLLDMMHGDPVPTIYGNHDCANPSLDENDSLMLLAKAGAVFLLDRTRVWSTEIEGRCVILGGSNYRQNIPTQWPAPNSSITFSSGDRLVIWLTHHDLSFPTAEQAAVTNLFEIDGIPFVINGHVHRRSPTFVTKGRTTWINPGNISRRSRADVIRGHIPSVLRMDITSDGERFDYVEVPHEPSSDVFFELEDTQESGVDESQSRFVTGLAQLQSRKTFSGAGLLVFLKENVQRFEPGIADEIMQLAQEIVTCKEI